MRIALIGATGFVGGFIMNEALERGHKVTGISRHPEKLKESGNLRAVKADVFIKNEISEAVEHHDAVISAYNPGWNNPDIYELYIKAANAIMDEVKASGVKRIIVIGGAGSLEVNPGVQLVDTPGFPKEYKAGALGARDALNLIKQINDLDWTFISPSIILQPGSRTGKFRFGDDKLITDKNGESRISVQDLAYAVLDEVENPKYIKRRFTVGY